MMGGDVSLRTSSLGYNWRPTDELSLAEHVALREWKFVKLSELA